jgi:signal transduction histidine kinase
VAGPWRWELVDDLLILAAGVANLANWRLNEDCRAQAEDSYRLLYEGQQAIVHQLEQSQKLKDELVNVVSHELRTPLTSIRGFGELLLLREDRLTAEQRRGHLERTLREAGRLERVVDNLIDSSKVIVADGSAVADLGEVLDTVVGDLEDAPGRDRVELRVERPRQARVAIAAEALRLVLANLLGNAVKYATPGTVVRVRAAVEPPAPGRLLLAVSNAAPPIPPEDRVRVFEPFVQLDSSITRAGSGVGLGLHIVRRLVEAYHGQVAVDSADGLVVFIVRLPLAAAPASGSRAAGAG